MTSIQNVVGRSMRSLAGHHGDAGKRYTEELQARFHERQIAMLETIPFLREISPWILQDFRSPRSGTTPETPPGIPRGRTRRTRALSGGTVEGE